MSVLVVTVVAWLFFLVAAARYAGWTSKVVCPWHPALGLAEVIVLRCSVWRCVPATLCGAALWAAVACQWWIVAHLIAAAVFGPLPAFLLEAARRDAFLQNLKIITINPLDPIHTTTKRVVQDGQAIEQPAMVYWFLSPAELQNIPNLGPAERTMLERYHVGGGLYAAEATNSFLQFFDSLDLYKNLVDSSNEQAMGAYVQAIKFYFGLSDGGRPGVLPPAAKPRPPLAAVPQHQTGSSSAQQPTKDTAPTTQSVVNQPSDEPSAPAPTPEATTPSGGLAEALSTPPPGKSKYKNWQAAKGQNRSKGNMEFKLKREQ